MIDKKKITAALSAVLLILNIALPCILAAPEGDVITISNVGELEEFAKKCTLDTWSQGKTVDLSCDLDLSGTDFLPIPTFGGVFNGNGYTLSGVEIKSAGSSMGLFRYVQTGGKITSLNVKGKIIPGGTKSHIGGIVGENYGTVEQCTFEGTVKGKTAVGAIVGINRSGGQITECETVGTVSGENYTGGTVGKNYGFIIGCTNNAEVNTVYEEKENDEPIIDTDAGAIIEKYKNSGEENREERLLGNTDTGGIAGFSDGIIQGCVNNGNIGCKHTGYNTGGIVGRQSGYVLGCENKGNILGRKDTGGIVGQAEPYVLLDSNGTSLSEIKDELNKLQIMTERLTADSDYMGDNVRGYLDDISGKTETARNSADEMLNIGADFADDNIAEINAQAAIISNTIDKLVPAFESLEAAFDDFNTAADKAAKALDEADIYFPDLGEESDALLEAVGNISDSAKNLKNASAKLNMASLDLERAVKFSDEEKVLGAASDMADAVKAIVTAKQSVNAAIDQISEIIKTKPESFEQIGINAGLVLESLKTIKENVLGGASALKTLADSLDEIILNTKINFNNIHNAALDASEIMNYLEVSMYYLSEGMKGLSAATQGFSDKMSEYADDMDGTLNSSKSDLADSIEAMSYASDDIKSSVTAIKDIITELADEEDFEFVKLGDGFRNESDSLFDSLAGISDGVEKLKNSLSGDTDTIVNDVNGLSRQFNHIMNLLIGEFEDLENKDVADYFIDVSDENIESIKQGKIEECRNTGIVEADRNVGGIVGAMAIEYSKDPEDDIEKPDTLNFTYRTKAILDECTNSGEVKAKKDCVGGVVGYSEIGTVYKCENYGDTETADGNYAGGIAGKSESTIRRSCSKSKVDGKKYAGGIVGKSESVSGCYAIATVSGEEKIGAISGYAEDKEKLYLNYFVDRGIGGVDGISYSMNAEPITFEQLRDTAGVPAKLISFEIKFIAEEKVISSQEIKYGDEIARIRYPNIPQKEGMYGTWQKPTAETVTEDMEIICDYKPYITLLGSEEKNSSGKLPLALAEGSFKDTAKLHITESDFEPPESGGESIRVYDISLENTETDGGETAVRILNGSGDDVTAWRLENGEWSRIKTRNRGKYTVVEIDGTSGTICLKYTKNYFALIFSAVSAVAVVFVIIKRKRKKIKRNKPGTV